MFVLKTRARYDLAKPFHIIQPATTSHVRVLRQKCGAGEVNVDACDLHHSLAFIINLFFPQKMCKVSDGTRAAP